MRKPCPDCPLPLKSPVNTRKLPGKALVALTGQPNSGKSTIFNVLTGARQHVANYPGLTVEQRAGSFRSGAGKVVVVDLPGTYSLTSYTQEERIARNFLLREKPDVIVDVMDASNFERNLYLALQLREMNIPLILDLNMIDVARRRGFQIDIDELSRLMGAPVVATVGSRGKGRSELCEAIRNIGCDVDKQAVVTFDYGSDLESSFSRLEARLSGVKGLPGDFPLRWLAIKLIENDGEVRTLVGKSEGEKDVLESASREREKFLSAQGESPERAITYQRYRVAGEIAEKVFSRKTEETIPLSDKVDKVACNRVLGPILLALVFFAFFKITMVYGQHLASLVWPYLARARAFLASALPLSGLPRSLVLNGIVDGALAILNYVPIFAVLFILIAILEDSGYMTRIAFIMDRLLRGFGLHGQSTLPMMLSGVVFGGCAVIGTMSTRGMKDPKARLTTIMILPLLNCMAKVPFYILMVDIFFQRHSAGVLWFMSIITLFIALAAAKAINLTLLRGQRDTPFVLEMPPYHLPTIRGVLLRTIERLWNFIKKVVTIVIAVAIIVWCAITFPGLDKERTLYYETRIEKAGEDLVGKLDDNPYAGIFGGEGIGKFGEYWGSFQKGKRLVRGDEAGKLLEEKYVKINPEFFKIVMKGKYTVGGRRIKDKYAGKAYRAYKGFAREMKVIETERRKEVVRVSYAGRFGRSVEPVTKLAGFDWRINIAMASSFAAKENLVATLGSIYSMEGEGVSQEALATTMGREVTRTGWTPLHALAVMLFVAIFPPCLATLIMVRLESGSMKWTLFVTIYPIILGFLVAVLVFQGGRLLGFGT